MSNLKEQVNRTSLLLSEIKAALEEQGIVTEGLAPKDYANAIRNIINDITIENVGLIPVLIFKYNKERPEIPNGGSWNSETNELDIPTGWYTDIDQQFDVAERLLPLWMSSAVFSSTGDIYKRWTTPVRISGQNGVDGKQGVPGTPGTVAGVTQFFNVPIFYKGDYVRPSTPIVSYDTTDNELFIPDGWSYSTSETEDGEVYWQSTVSYNTANNPTAAATVPIRITAESSVIKGNIRWYQMTDSSKAPSKGTSLWKQWSEDSSIAPTSSLPYLWCYDETIYSAENKTTSPVYLLCTYVKGLIDIDIAYTVGSSEDVISNPNYNSNFWFEHSKDALDINRNLPQHPDDEETNYYPGLNEKTLLLWCREKFDFLDGHSEYFYRIISYYKAAEKAPVLYSAGVFNLGVRYTRNEEQCPYVFYPAGLYLDSQENAITVTDENGVTRPAKDSDNPDGKKYQYFFLKNSYEIDAENKYNSFYDAFVDNRWKKIDSFEAIYSDIGIFKAALVGKFVFDDKYLFSMRGKDMTPGTPTYGKINIDYTNFTDTVGKVWEYDPDSGETTVKDRIGVAAAIEDPNADKRFIPSTLINAVTGESWFGNGTTKFYSDGEGDLANGAIGWRFEEDEDEPTLYIDGNVKIGKRAPEHTDNPTTPEEKPKSFSEVMNELYTNDESIRTTITTLEEGVETSIQELNSKLDKKVEYWFYDYDPLSTNYPQKDWHALDIEINHQFDIFVNKANQKVWVFSDNSVDGDVSFVWNEITDPTEKALYLNMAASADAQDGSITTFIGEDPSTEWISNEEKALHEGDLWLNGNGELKVWYCIGKTWGWHLPDMLSGNEQYQQALANWDKKLSEYQSTVEDNIGELNDRLDGRVVNHFYTGAPTLDNYPAKNWYRDPNNLTQTKGTLPEGYSDWAYNHIGDTYTDISEEGSTSGWSWRWCLDQDSSIHGSDAEGDSTTYPDNGFHWHRVADSTASALLAASKAQAAADGKTTTYMDKPTYYEVGDLWILNDNQSLKCFQKLNPSEDEKKSLFEIESGVWCKYPMGTLLNCKNANSTSTTPNYINDWDQSISYTQQQLFDKTVDEVNVTINGINASVVELNRWTDQMIQSYFGEIWPGDKSFDVDDNWVFDNPTGEQTLFSDHIGDTYTNTLPYDPETDYSNKSWRFEDYVEGKEFVKTYNNKYGWVEIADTSTLLALENAQKAQDTADGKRTTFIGNPTTATFKDPKEGDIAIDGNIIWVYKDNGWNTVYDKQALLDEDVAKAIKNQSDKTILNNFIYDDVELTEDVSECISWIKKQNWYASDYDSHIEDTITIIKSSSESNYPSYKIIAKNGSEPRVEKITDEKRLAALTQAAHSQEAIDGQIKTIFGATSEEDPKKGCPSGSNYNDGDICIVDWTREGKTTSISFVYKNGNWTETSTTLEQQLNKDVVAVGQKVEELETSFADWNKAHDGLINQYFDNVDVSKWTGDDNWEDDYPENVEYDEWPSGHDYKRAHVGDTYTKRVDGLDTSWVYQITNNSEPYTYAWKEITDAKTKQALEDAANAQISADGKIRNFVAQPTPPYSVGDTWTQGKNGGLLVCIKSKSKGDKYDVEDWTSATNYIDEATVNKSISDYDKLNNIFSAVFENDGATLSKYIGVQDESKKIVGALNGSNEWDDATHGKLIFSAGMNGIDNMVNANARIYADGTTILGGGSHSFYQDGSGFIAKENFSWDSDGNVSIGHDASKLNVDGSGHFANGLFGWTVDGNVYFGKEEDPGITITPGGQIQFGENISIGTDTTLKTLLTLASMWRLEGSSDNQYIKSTYPVTIGGDLTVNGNACAEGQVSAGRVADSSEDEHYCLGSIELDVVSLMEANGMSQITANTYGLTTEVINNLLLGRYTKVVYNNSYTQVYDYNAIKTVGGTIEIVLISGNLVGESYTTIELEWNGSTWTGNYIEA